MKHATANAAATPMRSREEPIPVTPVFRMLEEQANMMEVLGASVIEMEKVLDPILLPIDSARTGDALAPHNESPLSARIRQNNDMLNRIINHLQSIPTRIHLV